MYEVDCKELKKLMIDHDIENNTIFAEKTGVDRNTIARIFDGKILPTYRVIESIAKVLKMDSQQIGSIFFKQKVTQYETAEKGE